MWIRVEKSAESKSESGVESIVEANVEASMEARVETVELVEFECGVKLELRHNYNPYSTPQSHPPTLDFSQL